MIIEEEQRHKQEVSDLHKRIENLKAGLRTIKYRAECAKTGAIQFDMAQVIEIATGTLKDEENKS